MSAVGLLYETAEPVDKCDRCHKPGAQIESTRLSTKVGATAGAVRPLVTERLCLSCHGKDARPVVDKPRAPKSKPVKPHATVRADGVCVSVWPTSELAHARAAKVRLYLAQRPSITGDPASGYQVSIDSPLVPDLPSGL